MALKGMSTTLVIIVAAIVILITALVVVTVFGGGIQNFLAFFTPWSEDTIIRSQCDGACQQICLTYEGTGTPPAWSQVEVTRNGQQTTCGSVAGSLGLSCDCQNVGRLTVDCSKYSQANCPATCSPSACTAQ